MHSSLVALLVVFAVAFAAPPYDPAPRPEQSWLDRHESFVNNTLVNAESINVLFYGDSITDGWDNAGNPTFQEFYVPLGTANYGIGGDRAEHVLWRIVNGEVQNLSPKIAVLKIGTNNLGANNDTDIARGVAANVQELKARLPDMKILLLGVLPRTNEAMTIRTSNINDMISVLDNGDTTRFLDMKEHFYRGGNDFVTELYTADLLHLTAAGYAKWAEAMNPLFFEMFGQNSTNLIV
ncbi:unnamed protein product [Orchesella dallaii]|uniref:SGNH hydrolase-type esterase domain-containing protein n=1 Tax=Orchesella dallaii TaxID=48710 RepID=A0ABP1PNG4_9HEXA